jgi:dTMP kinase
VGLTRGLFVSFEGGEGSGKSTQAKMLERHLTERGASVLLTREPGGTPAGDKIREVLLHGRDVPLEAETQALLFMAARAQLVREVIRPALARGTHVVADRFLDSTFAYQGYGGGADLEELRAVARFAVEGTLPDLTFLLDLPIDIGLERTRTRADRWDRFEAGDLDFHRRVREGYLQLAAAEPRRWSVVTADRGEREVAHEIALRVDAALGTIRAIR